MSKVKERRWNIIVPIADKQVANHTTSYEIVKTINAPTYEHAVEEAKPIAKKYVDKYLRDTHDEEQFTPSYDARAKLLWRVQENYQKGLLIDKYI